MVRVRANFCIMHRLAAAAPGRLRLGAHIWRWVGEICHVAPGQGKPRPVEGGSE